jgi:uncharacterized membrane protein YbhN (UPF0104 family)
VKRTWVGTVIAIVALVLMVGYLATQRDLVSALRSVSPWVAVALVLISVVGLLIQAFQFRTAIGIHSIEMPVKEATAVTAANTMANYYLPVRGGMVVRAAYMYRVYRFPLAQYAAVTVAVTGLTILVAVTFGLVGLVLVGLSDGGVNTWALGIFAGIGAAAAVAVLVVIGLSGLIRGEGRFARLMADFHSAMSLWLNSRRQLAVFLGWTSLLFAVQALRLWLSFEAVGVSLTVAEMLVIQAMAAVAFILALTPGNIGVKEGAIVFAAGLLGVDPGLALLASLVDRAAAIVVTFGAGVLSVRYLARRMAQGADETADPMEPAIDEA